MDNITRLFNHTFFTNGEVKYFVQEFNDKTVKDNLVLSEMEQSSDKLTHKILPDVTLLLEQNLVKLQSKVPVCCEMSRRILSLDSQVTHPKNLEQDQSSEDIDDEFLKNIHVQKQSIMQSFNEATTKLNEEYAEMAKQVQRENLD